jgi:hypothetical protein
MNFDFANNNDETHIVAKLKTAATNFVAFIDEHCTSEQTRNKGQLIHFSKPPEYEIVTLPSVSLSEYSDVYLKYAVAAGNALAQNCIADWQSAPPIVECVTDSPIPICFQIGPFVSKTPLDFCSRGIIQNIANLICEVLEAYVIEESQHSIYFGYCGPVDTKITGSVSLFVWIPSIIKGRKDMARFRTDIANNLKDRCGREPKSTPIMTRNRTIVKIDAGTDLTDEVLAKNILLSGHRAGHSGIIPILWCADPARGINPSPPIMPLVTYYKYIFNDSPDGGKRYVEKYDYLTECESPHTSFLFGKTFTNYAILDYLDTSPLDTIESNSSDIVRNLGCRATYFNAISTYDTLGLVLSSSYSSKSSVIVSVELAGNIFNQCTHATTKTYGPSNFLRLMSADRFRTDTLRGLALCSEFLEALITENKADGICEPEAAAMQQLKSVAITAGVKNFDQKALAIHHCQNYDGRPSRSRRILAHYAQLDTPVLFSAMFASGIWQKLISITKADQGVLIAEAMAAYLSLDHYIITDANKQKIELYKYRSSHYEKIDHPCNYISGLLSPDVSCGKLYDLLRKFNFRLQELIQSGSPTDTSSSDGASTTGIVSYLRSCSEAINNIMNSLTKSSFKNNLVGEILTKLHQEQVHISRVSGRKMHDDKYLSGVKNGVLEVVRSGSERIIFWRQGTPDDMIMRRFNASYNENLRNGKLWNIVVTFFTRFIADPYTRLWLVCQLAEVFIGENNKIATFIVGPTDCGKSIFIDIFKTFLGEGMSESIPSNVLNDPKAGTDTPMPSLVKAGEGRIAFAEETSETIRNNIFKVICGGSAQTHMRTLYDGGASGSFNAKLWLAMNQLPKFENMEPAIFTRLAIIEPSSRFLNPNNPNLPKTDEERNALRLFPKDDSFVSIFRTAYDALLLYLMDHFGKWVDEKNNRTPLSAFTQKMRESADKVRARCPYASFCHRHLIAANSECKVSVKELFVLFKRTVLNARGYNEHTFSIAISNVLGPNPINGEWYGWVVSKEGIAEPEPIPMPAQEDDDFGGHEMEPEHAEQLTSKYFTHPSETDSDYSSEQDL